MPGIITSANNRSKGACFDIQGLRASPRASEPVTPTLRYKVMPAMWRRERLPAQVSRDEAIAFASARAVERKLLYLVIWSRKEEVLCYPDGRVSPRTMDVGEVPGPFLRLRGRGGKVGFCFG
jgi:hypothetical protein